MAGESVPPPCTPSCLHPTSEAAKGQSSVRAETGQGKGHFKQ